MKTLKRFTTGIIWGLTLFTAGGIFGTGFNFANELDVVRSAYNKGKRDGAYSVILTVLENGEIRVASK